MQGLDGAGKTTILYQLKKGKCVETVPTIGFNNEQITVKNLSLSITENGGDERIRALWKHYWYDAAVYFWVVDSTNVKRYKYYSELLISSFIRKALTKKKGLFGSKKSKSKLMEIPQDIMDLCYKYYVTLSDKDERIDLSRQLLHQTLNDTKACDIQIVLIYANKQDMMGAYNKDEMIDKLQLNRITKQKWILQPCCGITGKGLWDGLHKAHKLYMKK